MGKITDSAALEGKISELKMLKRKLIVLTQNNRMIENKLQKLVEDSKKHHGDLTDKDKVKSLQSKSQEGKRKTVDKQSVQNKKTTVKCAGLG